MLQARFPLIRFASSEPVAFGVTFLRRATMSSTFDKQALMRANLKTPKAAAVAGVLFSALLIAALWLLRTSIPADPLESGAWITTGAGNIALALNLIPFAGIAFLWFIGVLRDRL